MVNTSDDLIDSDSEEPENDVTSQRIAYQLHHQQIFLDDEKNDTDKVCNTFYDVDFTNLRIPSKEEIDRITAKMISQVHSNYNLRNRAINNEAGRPSSVFIKDTTHKINDQHKKVSIDVPKIKENKSRKWEPKKKVQFQIGEATKTVVQPEKSEPDVVKQKVVPTTQKTLIPGTIVKPTVVEPIDMIAMLSQITVKVPLSVSFFSSSKNIC